MKTIKIKGAIIANSDKEAYEFYGVEATSPNDVTSQLIDESEDIEVVISSGGGNVFAGSEIYTALKEHKGLVTVKIPSFAASSASIIAMAGDKVLMSPTAQLMIHNVSVKAGGDYRDMEHTAEVLRNANSTIANAYVLKTGLSEAEILAMMDNETWLSPQKAVELGFADEMMFANKQVDDLELVASGYNTDTLPQSLIKQFNMNNLAPLETNQVDFLMQKSSAKLKLLKLKGEMKS